MAFSTTDRKMVWLGSRWQDLYEWHGVVTGLSVKLHLWHSIFPKINKQTLSMLFLCDQTLGSFITGELGGQHKENQHNADRECPTYFTRNRESTANKTCSGSNKMQSWYPWKWEETSLRQRHGQLWSSA